MWFPLSRPAPLTISLLFLAPLPGCSGASSESGDSADTASSGLPEASTTFYIGTSDGQTPDGGYVAPTEELLFIRALDPAASTITEQVWSVGERNTVTAYELVHAVDVAAGTFTSTWVTDDGTILVDGAYDAGADWAWTAWHSTSVYQDGANAGLRVESVDHIEDSGVAFAEKVVYDAGGAETYQIVEELTPCSQDDFEEEFAAVGAT